MTTRDRGDVPVEVARFHWRHEAEMALGILEDEGIPGVVLADDAGGAYAGIAASRLVVPAEYADHARSVLAEMERDAEEGAEEAG